MPKVPMSEAELLAQSFMRSYRHEYQSLLDEGELLGGFSGVAAAGASLAAHGMTKFNPLQLTRDLQAILHSKPGSFAADQTGGHRRTNLDVAALTVDEDQGHTRRTRYSTAYRHGAYILVARSGVDCIADVRDIAGVLVNQAIVNHAPGIVRALQHEAPPHIMVRGYADVADIVHYARTGNPQPRVDDPRVVAPTIVVVDDHRSSAERARLAEYYSTRRLAVAGQPLPDPPAEVVLTPSQLPRRLMAVEVLPDVSNSFFDAVHDRIAHTTPAVIARLASGGWRFRVSKFAVSHPGMVGKVSIPDSGAVLAVDMHPQAQKIIDVFEFNAGGNIAAGQVCPLVQRSILDPLDFAHDIGHAIDRELGYPSNGKAFGGAHFSDTAVLTTETRGQNSYFVQGQGARRETWAEAFAMLERGYAESAFAQTIFPQSTAAVAETLRTQIGPDWACNPQIAADPPNAAAGLGERRSGRGSWNHTPT